MRLLCSFLFSFICSHISAQLSEDSIIGAWEVRAITIQGKVEDKVKKKANNIFLQMIFTFKQDGIVKVTSPKKGNAELSEFLYMLDNTKWQINKHTNQVRLISIKDNSPMAEFVLKKNNEKMDFIFSETPPPFILRAVQIKTP